MGNSVAVLSAEGWDWTQSKMPSRFEKRCLLPAAACLPVGEVLGLPVASEHLMLSSHPWQGQAFPYSKSPLVFCFVPCFVGCGLGFFFLALHEKYSVKFCGLLQGCAEPNLKSAECVWSHLRCHRTHRVLF